MKFFLVCATLIGTIIGVGIFSLPAVTVEAGWHSAVVVSVAVLAAVILTHVAYAHVVVLTATPARLPGYAGIWLGPLGKHIAFFSQILGFIGSSTAYILLGGIFLSGLLGIFVSLPLWLGPALFTVAGAALVWRGAKSIAEAELVMVIAMVLAIVLLAILGGREWSWDAVASVSTNGSPWRLYGVLMFALWGMSVVPQVAEVTAPGRTLGQTVFAGVFVSFILTALFVLLIIGTEGRESSRDALTSLVEHGGKGIKAVGYGFGVLATFTSYIALSRTNMDMLRFDLHQPRVRSFFIVVGFPLILLAAGVSDFVTVIAVTGAVSLGLEGALVLLIEEHVTAARPRRKLLHIPPLLRIFTVLLLAAGMVIELLATFGLL